MDGDTADHFPLPSQFLKRRNAVSSEVDGWRQVDVEIIRKTKEDQEMLLSAMCADAFFQLLESQQLDEIQEAFYLQKVALNSSLCCEGGESEHFYVVATGELEQIVKGKSAGILHQGQSNGHAALLHPVRRDSTLKAVLPNTSVWCLNRSVFRNIVCSAFELRLKQIEKALRKVALFACVSDRDFCKLAEAVETKRYPNGYTIIEQGAEGDAFFVVLEGTAVAVRNDHVLHHYCKGECFGERALITNQPRAASVFSVADCVVGVIDRIPFQSILGDCQDFLGTYLKDMKFDNLQDLDKTLEKVVTIEKKQRIGKPRGSSGETAKTMQVDAHMDTPMNTPMDTPMNTQHTSLHTEGTNGEQNHADLNLVSFRVAPRQFSTSMYPPPSANGDKNNKQGKNGALGDCDCDHTCCASLRLALQISMNENRELRASNGTRPNNCGFCDYFLQEAKAQHDMIESLRTTNAWLRGEAESLRNQLRMVQTTIADMEANASRSEASAVQLQRVIAAWTKVQQVQTEIAKSQRDAVATQPPASSLPLSPQLPVSLSPTTFAASPPPSNTYTSSPSHTYISGLNSRFNKLSLSQPTLDAIRAAKGTPSITISGQNGAAAPTRKYLHWNDEEDC